MLCLLFLETSENETEKLTSFGVKNKNLSLDSLNPQALMLLQAYFAQTKSSKQPIKDKSNHVNVKSESSVTSINTTKVEVSILKIKQVVAVCANFLRCVRI